MGLENHLILLGQAVQYLTAGFLELGMEEYLRVFHHDNAGNPALFTDIGL